jgi:hypothetical protein
MANEKTLKKKSERPKEKLYWDSKKLGTLQWANKQKGLVKTPNKVNNGKNKENTNSGIDNTNK